MSVPSSIFGLLIDGRAIKWELHESCIGSAMTVYRAENTSGWWLADHGHWSGFGASPR